MNRKADFLLNKSIRIDSHNESIRIANWNALYRTAYGKAYGRAPDLRSRGRGFGVSDDSQWGAAANDCRQVVYTHEPEPLSPSIIIWYGRRGSYTVPACVLFLLRCLKTVDLPRYNATSNSADFIALGGDFSLALSSPIKVCLCRNSCNPQ